jgi:hypothetical protein
MVSRVIEGIVDGAEDVVFANVLERVGSPTSKVRGNRKTWLAAWS